VFPLEIGYAVTPQLFHHLNIFLCVIIAVSEVLVAGPDAHLFILGRLPSGNNIDPWSTLGLCVFWRGGILPNLPGAIESMVTAIRAHSAGGSVRMAVEAKV
jgi:hypothetical protein